MRISGLFAVIALVMLPTIACDDDDAGADDEESSDSAGDCDAPEHRRRIEH